ncbi:MAG: hypothetical protein E6G27_16735 [Actinobacteria bacterium]|nr:MAG: hypothetical protein E6G27_16735 [Actinomycetota bacterium]
MGNLMYLLVAAGLSLVGSIILVLRARKPTSMEAGIQEFSRELRALAPDGAGRRATDRPGREGRAG